MSKKKVFDDPSQQLFKPRGRMLFFKYFVLLFFIILGTRFWFLQVVNHDHYVKAAENNRIREIPISAPRGTILDREGRILVDSTPTYSVVLYQEDMVDRESTLQVLIKHFSLDRDSLIKLIEAPGAKGRPVVIKTNASYRDRAWIEAHEFEHPELKIELQSQRRYPLGEVLAHVVGYVGEIGEEQLRDPNFDYCKAGDIIGQAGLEQSYNKILMGKEGYRRVLVDSRGRVLQQLEEIPPTPGQDIVTTIDLDIQKVAEEKLTSSGFYGTVVINDPRDGGILALASHPSFDPNLFAAGIKPADFNRLINNPKHPLRNRAIQDRYPPGSTWKILMAVAGLEEKSVTDKQSLPCGGGITTGGRFVHCYSSHGAPDMRRAIEISCDGYFYREGIKLGIEHLEKWEPLLGVGVKTGIDLPNETKGIVPTRQWKRREYPKDPQWKEADMVYASIGQSGVSTTPIQMMYSITGIGMGGKYYTPHLFKEARATEYSPAIIYQPKLRDAHISEETWKVVSDGMWRVVNGSGTARRAAIPGFDVSGKTGTAQVVGIQTGAKGEEKEHAWFVSYAPRGAPEIGGVCLVEHAGHGGVESAPIIKACYEEYLRKKQGVSKDEVVENNSKDSKRLNVKAVSLVNTPNLNSTDTTTTVTAKANNAASNAVGVNPVRANQLVKSPQNSAKPSLPNQNKPQSNKPKPNANAITTSVSLQAKTKPVTNKPKQSNNLTNEGRR
jgi:penicillin-binding protein 2